LACKLFFTKEKACHSIHVHVLLVDLRLCASDYLGANTINESAVAMRADTLKSSLPASCIRLTFTLPIIVLRPERIAQRN
jgi:hypothetical protein